MTNLTTAQVSGHLDMPVPTIHSHKKRNPERLCEGIHWVMNAKRLEWTQQGIDELRAIAGIPEVHVCSESESHTSVETPSDSSPLSLSANATQGAIAIICGGIEKDVMDEVKRIISDPTADEWKVINSFREQRLASVVDFGFAWYMKNAFQGFAQDIDAVLERAKA